MPKLKMVSFNVNGLRAIVKKDFEQTFKNMDADFFCLQETKLQKDQIDLTFDGYSSFWNYADKKGYSGTAIFTRHEPMNVITSFGIDDLDTEGRLIALEYKSFFIITSYVPNAQDGLKRIAHRLKWEDAFVAFVCELDKQKPVIFCGDLNVAHNEIDLKNPKTNKGNPGFSDEERTAFTRLLGCGFTDTFRFLYPDLAGVYSWWSYRFNARQNNSGWRIDYFCISDRLKENIIDAKIHGDIFGSDHCPVSLEIDIEV